MSKTTSITSNTSTTSNTCNVCVVLTGNVDSGKSTFLSVMTNNVLDDGNGSARSKVAKHKHELDSGKTSDITVKSIKLSNGDCVHNVDIVDLCGHQKYLRTTMFGITGYFPDYGVLVVAANRGLLPMTKEHMGILLYMDIPFIIVITRIDLVADNPTIYNKTVNSIKRIFKRFNKQVRLINSNKELELQLNVDKDAFNKKVEADKITAVKLANVMQVNTKIVPVVTVSNKTGYYIDVVREMLCNLKPREIWSNSLSQSINQNINQNIKTVFYIDSKFTPKGVGLVVSGVLKGNSVKLGDELLIGPYGKTFVPVKVWSIHDNYKNSVPELNNRMRGCFAIRILDKKIECSKHNIRKGMVIINKQNYKQQLCYEFECNIKILNHTTTISSKYSPVIHCGTVRQTAQIILDDKQVLRIHDEALVKFRFVGHPEYLESGTRFFFREGVTRGVGHITNIIPI